MTDHVTDYLRHAGQVIRYHTWPTIQTQTIGEHSWQVALIYEQIFGELSSPVERYIRMHDVAELVVGDIPFPVKSQNPRLATEFQYVEDRALGQWNIKPGHLHMNVKRRIKICDLLEMMCFGMTEREMGNLLAIPIIHRTRAAALDLADKMDMDQFNVVLKFVEEAEARHNRVLAQVLESAKPVMKQRIMEKVHSDNG